MPRYYAVYFGKWFTMTGCVFCRRFLGTIQAETDRQARVRLDWVVLNKNWHNKYLPGPGFDAWRFCLISPEGRVIGDKCTGRTQVCDFDPDKYWHPKPLSQGDFADDEYDWETSPPYIGLLNNEQWS